VTYNTAKGKPESQIVSYLKKKSPGTLVVLGAYQRSNLSRVFRQSMAETLMEKTDLTLFIAHSI
jgi:nucleotide-binding universal stress UspA family protein